MRPRASSGESKFYLNAIPTRSRIIVIIATPSPSRQLKSALGRPQPPARSCHSRVRPFSIQRFVMVKSKSLHSPASPNPPYGLWYRGLRTSSTAALGLRNLSPYTLTPDLPAKHLQLPTTLTCTRLRAKRCILKEE